MSIDPLSRFRFSLILFAACLLTPCLQAQKLASAPIRGHTTPESMKIWTMFRNVDEVVMKLYQGNKVVNKKTIDLSGTKFWRGYKPLTVEFLRLESGTRYELEMILDEEVWPERFSLSTEAYPSEKDYSFLLGSCALKMTGLYKMMWRDHPKIYRSMSAVPSDFMLWMGDNVYLLFGEWNKARRFQKKFTKVRLNKAINDFLLTRPNYATWDDHDYGPNDADGTFENKKATLANFQAFWPNPYFGTDETPGVFSHFRFQDSEFFLLDDRYHRIDSAHTQILGPGQMAWLQKMLSTSTATFKFIVHGSQVLNELNSHECFAMYEERQVLFDFIKEKEIEGVVFLSGDRHFTELLKLEQEGMYPFYEFTNSPITSFVRKKIRKEKDPEHVNPIREEGTLVAERNFGKIEISGPMEDRVCTMKTFDEEGVLKWKRIIRARELRMPE